MASSHMIWAVSLRIMAFAATFSAAIIMFTAHESVTVVGNAKGGEGGGTIEMSFTDSDAFKYFVAAHAIGTVYTTMVLYLPSNSLLWRLVVAVDGIFAILLTSSTSATMAISGLYKSGSSSAGWDPICSQVPTYCSHIVGALIGGTIGSILYILLLLHSFQIVLNPLLVQEASPA